MILATFLDDARLYLPSVVVHRFTDGRLDPR